jgi:dihydroflavonol-4-reductase
MHLLVLGATGMLGQQVARAAAAAGHDLSLAYRDVKALSRFEGLRHRAVRVDLDDAASLRAALHGVDTVLHAAAPYPTVPRGWQAEVAAGVARMDGFYRACEQAQLRQIVYLGGAIALQRRADGQPGDETCDYPGPPPNRNPYVQLKWALDAQARQEATKGLPVSIGIPSMTFGEYDYGPSTGRLLLMLARGQLPNYVRGNRNVVYGGDAGRGLVAICERGRRGERYLLTGENTSMDALTAQMAVLAKQPVPRPVPLPIVRMVNALQTLRWRFGGPLPTVDATAIAVMSAGQHLSGEKARRELGFQSQVPLQEALERTLHWFRQVGYLPS